MRCLEIIHDKDMFSIKLNIDRYAEENNFTQKKIVAGEMTFPGHDEYDLLFLHGGSQHLWNKDADPWLRDEIVYIKNAVKRRKKIIGICLGSQLLAEALGGRVYEAPEKEFGWYPVFLSRTGSESPLMNGIENGFISMHWHGDHFSLPGRAISLAFTEVTPNQAFVSLDYPIAAFQFHPEYPVSVVNEIASSVDKSWTVSRYVKTPDDIQAMADSIPDSYVLFSRLMDNALLYFSKFKTG